MDKILNPATGKYVLKTGKIGKLLLQKQTSSSKKCNTENKKYKINPNLYICNPQTGNWVLKTGTIGKLLSVQKPPQKPPSPISLYKNQLYKTKAIYNLTIPELDKLGIQYDTWDNKDNTAGTCFWHAISKGLGLTMHQLADKINAMTDDLPPSLQNKYKTKSAIVNKLKNYKTTPFGMGPKEYCIIPKISPDTALIIFAVREVKPKQFKTIGVFCVFPENTKPTKVIFLCDYVFLHGGHIEIMTLNGKQINNSWSQDIKSVANELKSILTRPTCKNMVKKI
jgi:hypothetical protein